MLILNIFAYLVMVFEVRNRNNLNVFFLLIVMLARYKPTCERFRMQRVKVRKIPC